MSATVVTLSPAEAAIIEILGAVIQTITVTDNVATDRLRQALGKLGDQYLSTGNDAGLAVLRALGRATPSGLVPEE